MHRRKIRLLKQLSGSDILGFLPSKALKVYLLLLASARQIGREQTIDLQIIRRVLGGDLTRGDLLEIGMVLEDCGLAAFRSTSRTPKSAGGGILLRFQLMDLGSRVGHEGGKRQSSRFGRG